MNIRSKGLMNIVSDLISQVTMVILGLIIPRLVLTNLGSESNGLISTLSQVLSYVALLEAGVGAASLQALFSPIESRKKEDINGIIAATNYFYVRIGGKYIVILSLLAIVFPFTIESDIPRFTIFAVVLISGIPSAINFFFQGKYIIFLNAIGKTYIIKYIGVFIYIINAFFKIVLLNLGYGLIAIQSLGILSAVIQVLIIEIYIHKVYGWISIKSEPNFSSIKQSKNVLLHQVAWLVTSNTDTIILTYVCGLKVVSVYAMYRLFLGMIDKVIESITSGLHFAMGYYYQRDIEKYKRILNVLEVVIIGLTFSLFCVANCFLIPFLGLYTEGINDVDYLDYIYPWLFAIVHSLIESRAPAWETISVAGHFKETQKQPIIEAIINLLVSFALVFSFGIYGVLIGTIVASTYRIIAMVEYSERKILNISPASTYRRYLIGVIMFFACSYICQMLLDNVEFDSYQKIVGYALCATLIIVPVFFLVLFVFEKQTFSDALIFLKIRRK